ncbi:MAG: IclR family transcriptional regulator [Naasia sp.]|jgi:DNA-binding IclR family transcriptional regulator|uniref:IclR family transcriptional regulator n=1 Tax=Naasia sp. TaxID=2546198 RepID=UPI002617E0AB|nr:IclR family transcriptional regulator [Naasia sp.]MCU1570425.1 IclR family transcriptional regulator [Naasia sp.]
MSPSQPGAPAARHTLLILQFLGNQRGPVGAATIAGALGLPRSTVYRLLNTLREFGFVLHFPEERRYGIGIGAFELSSGFTRQEPLSRLARPILATLVDRLGESAHLAALHGQDVIYLVEERAPRRPALVTDVGVRLPSHLTASGRALLATLPRAQLRALFPATAALAQRQGSPELRLADLLRLLEEVKRAGYAAEDGDVTAGLASVAVAVRDHAGWPAAGITLTFPRENIPLDEWPSVAETLRVYAAELSRRIRGVDSGKGP